MSADHYLREKCGPDTSDFYAVLFAPRAKREGLRAVQVFGRELREIAEQPGEPAVARSKLEWWRAEIERAAASTPRHPAMRALAAPLGAGNVAAADLQAVVNAAETALEPPVIHTLDDFATYSARTAGLLLGLAARLLGLDVGRAATLVPPLATAQDLARLITTLGANPGRSKRLMPQELLAHHGIGPDDWRGPHTSARMRELLEELTRDARARYARSMVALSPADLPLARPILIHAAIEHERLLQVANDSYPVLREQTRLPPLRMLFIAVRARIWPAHLDA